MTEMLNLTLAFLIGAGIGTLFFGGLWWTVVKGVTTKQPGLLFLGSFLLRIAAVCLVFTMFARGHFDRLALCLLGFLVVRAAFLRAYHPLLQDRGKGDEKREGKAGAY
jgi:F1F0 ATPase subunit 2